MIVIIIFLFITVLFAILSLFAAFCSNDKADKICACITSSLLFVGCGCLISCIHIFSEPTAIDVYRGKTTLQITYQDSIPVDTIVVFKNQVK